MSTPPERIISLLPAATEILFELGAGDRLVGVSHDCDWPEPVRDRPTVSSSIVDSSESSRSIDRQVREAQHAGRSIYHVDEDRMDQLNPDLVVTQEQCDVCAPRFEDVRDSCRRTTGDPEIISLEPTDLDDVLATIDILGQAVDRPEAARKLIDNRTKRQERMKRVGEDAGRTPRVACVEWLDPMFVGGHWVPEMVEELGGISLGTPGGHSHEIEWSDVAAHEPDAIVLMPCGFETERAEREGRIFLDRIRDEYDPDLSGTSIYAVDGSSYFSRPGPRLWDGMELLGALIHPEKKNEFNDPGGAAVELE